jgi:hypothetical protein
MLCLPVSPLIARALEVAEKHLGKKVLSERLECPDTSIDAWRRGQATMPQSKSLQLIDILKELDIAWDDWNPGMGSVVPTSPSGELPPSVVVTKPDPHASDEAIETMARETDLVLARSRHLIKQVEELLETCRQLRAAQQALLEQRERNKRSK